MAASNSAATPEDNRPSDQPSTAQIRTQLEKILTSSLFMRSERLCRFLRVTVELTLSGETDRIKEYTLGRDVFDRDKNYDPRVDSIVRVEARRLRKKLQEYYDELGIQDPVAIEFPQGSYVPAFKWKQPPTPRPIATTPFPETRPLNPLTVAVLPFHNISPDPHQDFFCDGITEEILNTLTSIPQLNVVARTSVFRFKDKRLDIRDIGKQLHAGTVIEGSVRKAENRLRISVQAIDAAQGVLLWTGTFDRELRDVFAVQDEIARAIANSLHVTLTAHTGASQLATREQAIEAYTLLLKGRHYWNQVSQEGPETALEEYKQAIARDPDFAPPYAALADAYAKITFWGVVPPGEGIPQARQAALAAIRLDQNLGEAYAILGAIACCYDWNWEEGARLFRRANELQPSSMNAIAYDGLRLVFLGEFETAGARFDRASELDPLSPWTFRNLSWCYYYQRQYDRAVDAMKSALALDPNFREGQFLLAYAFLRLGRYPEALELLHELPEGAYRSTKWGALGETYALAGDRVRALDALRKIDALSSVEYVSPIDRASIYAGLGDWDRMFAQLEEAYVERTLWLCSLKVDPRYDAVRSDSRLRSLVERIHLL